MGYNVIMVGQLWDNNGTTIRNPCWLMIIGYSREILITWSEQKT